MKILYISNTFPIEEENSTIYTDLAEELSQKGHEMTVVATTGSKNVKQTQFTKERNMDVLRIKTDNIIGGNFIKKGFNMLKLVPNIISSMKKNIRGKYDLILFESPPVTMATVVKWAMKEYDCPSYLMLKDIFPQNAVDLKVMSNKSIIYYFFKRQEKLLYETATKIGCMSEENKKYILKENSFISEKKVEIFPNTKKVSKKNIQEKNNSFRNKYNIPLNNVIALYGGNMGKPQGLDFLLEIFKEYRGNNQVTFVLVGRGTEKEKIEQFTINNKISNVLVLDELQRDEYQFLVSESDIGLIFLNKSFTIPNYPSRVLSYFEAGLPILAATDNNTDFRALIEKSKSGYWTLSGDLEGFREKLNKLIESKDLRVKMGEAGRAYLETNLNVSISVEILENAYRDMNTGRHLWEEKNV